MLASPCLDFLFRRFGEKAKEKLKEAFVINFYFFEIFLLKD